MSDAQERPDAPYKGLVPFSEEDSPFFFGRDLERDLIAASLRGARLTLLYGASGVGKSSLLQAGLVPNLRQLGRDNLKQHSAPELAVAAFSTWQGNPLRGLLGAVAMAVQDAWNGREFEPVPENLGLTKALQVWTERLDGVLLILLDQFEEYLIYQPDFGESGFDAELAQAVNAPDLRVGMLISLQEEALARLDRFEGQIPGLFANYFRLEHLDREAGREAIVRPLEEWNRRLGLAGEQAYRAEAELIEEILNHPAIGNMGGDGAARAAQISSGARRIETPYLQLVLSRLWEEEVRFNSRLLRKATLVEVMGGAKEIVQTHLDGTLSMLSADQRGTVAGVLRYLVTPVGDKARLTLADLAEYARLPPEWVEPVLRLLSSPSVRIVRAAADPEGAVRYEIFHDVLVPAVLDWRRRFEWERERTEATENLAREKEKFDQERKKSRWLIAGLIGMAGLFVAFILFTLWAFRLQERAERQERAALASKLTLHAFKLRDERLDLGLLLSIHAQELSDEADKSSALISSLSYAPGLEVFLGWLDSAVLSLASTPDGKKVIAGGVDGTVRLWSIPDGRPLGEISRIDWGSVSNLSFSSDGRTLAALAADGTVRLWSIADSLTPGASFRMPGASASNLTISPDGRMLALAGSDGTVHLWPVALGGLLGKPLRSHISPVKTLSFSSDGQMLATGASDGTVNLWSVTSDSPVGSRLQGPGAEVEGISFSPDGRMLAAGGSDGTVRVWSVLNRENLLKLEGNSGPIWSTCFGPDSQTLASGSEDGTVRLWSAFSGDLLGEPFRGHRNGIRSIAFTPDGRRLISGQEDGTVRLWSIAALTPQSGPIQQLPRKLNSGILRDLACGIANRNLSSGEWIQYLGKELPYRRTCPKLPSGAGAASQ